MTVVFALLALSGLLSVAAVVGFVADNVFSAPDPDPQLSPLDRMDGRR